MLYPKGKQEGGGLITYLENTSRAMADLGHDVTIVTSGPRGRTYYEGKVRVAQAGQVPTLLSFRQILDPTYLFRRIGYMVNATRYILKNSFDIVEAADGGFEHFFLLFFKRCPVVVRMHGSVSFKSFAWRPNGIARLIEYFEKSCLMKSDGISVPNKSFWEYAKEVNKISHRRVEVIPYGIFLGSSGAAIDVRNRYGLQGKKIVLYCGFLEWRKGTDILLNLAQKYTYRNDLVFVLLGEAYCEYGKIEKLKNVLYLGHRSSDEVFSFYAACDLFFMPSRLESGPINVLEAMACGKPILGSNAVGIKDEVEDGVNGLLFDLNNEEDLRVKFEKMIDDPALLGKFGRESLRLADKYEIHRVARLAEKFYQEVVSGQR